MSGIAEVLGRPIAFHRAFVGLGIGVTGAVMLSQAIYWSRRTDAEDGWFYKTQDDWEAETGLTRREQETARRRLTAIGVLKEERRGVPAKLFFYVDQQALADALGVHTSMAESANLVSTKAPRQYGGKRQSIYRTETTTDTIGQTDEKASGREQLFDLFWASYPRKVGKGDARKSFFKLKPTQSLLGDMLKTLAWQSSSEQWKERRYIPNPSTWLNQERWLDEPEDGETSGVGVRFI